MSGQPRDSQNTFWPAPVGGLNLLQPPVLQQAEGSPGLNPTEARKLDNYYCYDYGIKERGAFTFVNTIGSPLAMHAFTSATIQGFLMNNAGTTYTYNGTAFNNIGSASWSMAFDYNKIVFMPRVDGTQAVATYNLNTDTFSATSFTIPVGFTTNLGWAFKDRVYLINDGTGEFRYGDVGAITGTLSSAYDLGQFFQRGRYLTFGAAWNYNQGQVNEELCVMGNDAGEVFVFSGDYPTASNWQLIARLDLPSILQRTYGPSAAFSWKTPSAIIKLGQDILVNTTRGVVSLSQVMSGRSEDDRYYLKSRKIGAVLNGSNPDRSVALPFAYYASDTDVYVLNYETGAWSKFPSVGSGSSIITNICCSSSSISSTAVPASSLVLISVFPTGFPPGGASGFYKLDEFAATNDATATYAWSTPYFNPARGQTFTLNLIRQIGRTNLTTSVRAARDLQDSTFGGQATNSGSAYLELSPPATGKWLSLLFSKTGSGGAVNETIGLDVFYSTGGTY